MKKLQLGIGIVLLAAWPLAAATISPLPYGINVHLASNEILAKTKAAGIAWIRIDIDWSTIETSKGKFNFAEVDRVVNYAAANGLSLYASISSTPGWANGKKGRNHPANNVNDWKSFVARTVNRYKSNIRYWGIWNEPNLDIFFAPGKDVFVQKVLLPAAQTIRATDAAAFIVGPELAHLTTSGSEWYFWMKYILDNAGNYFDIISHHLYEDLGVYFMYELLEEGDHFIPAVKTIVEESGQGGKPFWITETGWNTNRYSETMQANRYLDMLHARARKNYPHKVFFYEISDDPRPSVLPWGILRRNLEAKPAYKTYKDYIAGLLPDPGNPDEGKTNKKCYAEETAGNGAPAEENAVLQSMLAARDLLRGYSSAASATVDIYYQWNEEFLALSLADSRIFRLGREIMEKAQALLKEGGWQALERTLPRDLQRCARDLAGLIRDEYPDSPLAPLARLVDGNLAVIGSVPPRDLLEFYLKEEILRIKKTR
ncbi:MAG: cellulase family glycosylhydrolase [Acidobacteria bacterium]|nr:cellulase family glycosylhydrolase [Acidobacteriota bacterium]